MHEEVRRIDSDTWPRRRHFELFSGFAYPYFNLCADVDVGPLVRAAKARRSSVSAHLVYALVRSANAVPELRQRIRGDHVVEHDVVHPSMTVIGSDELFSFCSITYDEDAQTFVRVAIEAMDAAREAPSIEDEPGRDDLLFLTAIPWVSFTSLVHPAPLDPPDSIPRIAWGRFRMEGERMPMPLSLHAHHGLVDGLHAGRFFEGVRAWIESVEQWADGRA